MRFIYCCVCFLFLSSALVCAQGGHIGLYADTWGSNCTFDNKPYAILEIHVVHMDAPGISASQFSLRDGGGFTGAYLGEELSPHVVGGFGNSQEGISIAYGDCYASPLHILTVRYLIEGHMPKGSYLKVVPDPHAIPEPGIWAVDCSNSTLLPASGGIVIVNDEGVFCCESTPVVQQTWGAIKVLYD